jgi:hypothetical protein
MLTMLKRLPQWVKIGAQANKLKSKIKAEHKWLTDFLNKEKIDVSISDNRYGLYSSKVHSIFIGHQLSIQSPLLSKKTKQYSCDTTLINLMSVGFLMMLN